MEWESGGGLGTTINTKSTNKFFNLTINSTENKEAITELDVDGDFTILGGTFINGNLIHNVAGNWDDATFES